MLSLCLIVLIALVMPLHTQAQTAAPAPAPIWHEDASTAGPAADTAHDPAMLEEYRQARLDYEAGLYWSAIQRLAWIAARDETFVRAFDNLGLCYEAQNDSQNALQYYRKAVRLNRATVNPSPWPPFNLGVFWHHHGGSLVETESLLKESIGNRLRGSQANVPLQWHLDLARVYYELGTLLEQRRRHGEALNALKLATREDPSYLEPQDALAQMAVRAKALAQTADTLHP